MNLLLNTGGHHTYLDANGRGRAKGYVSVRGKSSCLKMMPCQYIFIDNVINIGQYQERDTHQVSVINTQLDIVSPFN